MIYINENLYSEEFKEEYYQTAFSVLESLGFDEKQFISELVTFFPSDFFETVENPLRYLVLLSPREITRVKKYVDEHSESTMNACCYKEIEPRKKLHEVYQLVYDAYPRIARAQKNKTTMRVRLVQELNITICPYCNRDYINCRDTSTSGAQLDHFYSQDGYPFFSICLYNLVPVCANCNRIKSSKDELIISPFDIKSKNSIKFSYTLKSIDTLELTLDGGDNFIHNINLFKLFNAYEIHVSDIQEILEKSKIYNKTQTEEILHILESAGVNSGELKSMIFGQEYSEEDLRNKSLGKLKNDIRKDLNIDSE